MTIMKTKCLITASALFGGLLLPLSASANCPPVSGGSASISCEQGVRVIRQSQGALPRVSLETVQRHELERKRLAAQREAAARQARLQQQRLKLEQQRLNNESYLYRDANSPLRYRRSRGVIVLNNGR
jgi:hypothetical protein